MEEQPSEDRRKAVVEVSAGDKLQAAFELLTSAFQDSRIDSITLTKQDLVAQAATAQQVLNTVWALQSARLAQAAAIEQVTFPDASAPEGFREHEVHHAFGVHRDEFIGCEIGPMLGWTSGQTVNRVGEATDAITRTPRLFQRVGTGELEPAKLVGIHRALGRVAREIDDEGTPVTLDLARQVESALLGGPEESAGTEQASIDLLARSSVTQVQRRTGRVLASIDPVADRRAAHRRRRDRVGVFAHPDDEPGLTQLHAILPSAVAAKVMAAVDRHAKELHADTRTGRTLAECRADAFADLILDNAHVTTQLVIQVPVHPVAVGSADAPATAFRRAATDDEAHGPTAFVHPLTGLTVVPGRQPITAGTTKVRSQDAVDRDFNDLLKRLHPPGPDDFADWELDDECAPSDLLLHHGELRGAARTFAESPDAPLSLTVPSARLGDATIPGIGIIPAGVIEAISRSFGTSITRALVDATTGTTLETCGTPYKPSPRLQHFVETRDVHCRFPGCTRAARWCDLDHVIPWPEGPTAAYNLHCLCRHHHRAKQAHGWSVTMTPEGVCTWTSPSGRSYVTTPGE